MQRRSTRMCLLFLVLALAGVVAAVRSASQSGRATGPLRQYVYVWQRAWTPSVVEAVRAGGADRLLASTLLLAAQISSDPATGTPKVFRPNLDWPTIASLPTRPGFVIRISGSTSIDQLPIRRIVREILSTSVDRNIQPAEIQIDYDCPSSRLESYQQCLLTLRNELSHYLIATKLTITALPSWIGHPSFIALAHTTDGFVLQVHALHIPNSPGEHIQLCDAEEARRYAEQFATLNIPFRVSLPTYSYEVGFDKSGRRIGVHAEAGHFCEETGNDWPPETTTCTLGANAAELASLTRDWMADRPAALVGISWFRLPVEGDRMNWTLPTLHAVASGKSMSTSLGAQCKVDPIDRQLRNVVITNQGTSAASVRSKVNVTASQCNPIEESDGVGGFDVAKSSGSSLIFSPSPTCIGELRPGDSRTIGWIRIAATESEEIHATIVADVH